MNRLVIVGGAGFIGSHIVESWIRGNFLADSFSNLVIIDNGSTDGFSRIEGFKEALGVEVINLDVRETEILHSQLRSKDIILLLAANPDISLGWSNPDLDFHRGTVLTHSVIEASRRAGVGGIFFSSGSGVYGDNPKHRLSETDAVTETVSPYGASKLASEAMISSYSHMFGIPSRVARFANVVGGGQTHGVAFDFAKKLSHNPRILEVLGDGNQLKSYVHISDVLSAISLIIEDMLNQSNIPFRVFNVASEDRISVRRIAKIAVSMFGQEDETQISFESKPYGWPGDVPSISLDTELIQQELGWSCQYSSEIALKKALNDLKESR